MARLALCAALVGLVAAGSGLPSSVSPALACLACNATLVEASKLVETHRHRMGIQNAVTHALDTVCEEGQRLFVTYNAPPLPLKKACFALMERSEEKFEAVLLKRKPPHKATRKLCKRWCDAAQDAPPPEEPADSLVRIDNVPLPLVRADDGHMEVRTEHEDL